MKKKKITEAGGFRRRNDLLRRSVCIMIVYNFRYITSRIMAADGEECTTSAVSTLVSCCHVYQPRTCRKKINSCLTWQVPITKTFSVYVTPQMWDRSFPDIAIFSPNMWNEYFFVLFKIWASDMSSSWMVKKWLKICLIHEVTKKWLTLFKSGWSSFSVLCRYEVSL